MIESHFARIRFTTRHEGHVIGATLATNVLITEDGDDIVTEDGDSIDIGTEED